MRVKLRKRCPGRKRERFDEFSRFLVIDEIDIVFRLAAKDADDEFELVEAFSAGKEWFSAQEFGEDAPDGPNVDRGAVVFATEEKLGGPVPPGDHVFGHELVFAVVGTG